MAAASLLTASLLYEGACRRKPGIAARNAAAARQRLPSWLRWTSVISPEVDKLQISAARVGGGGTYLAWVGHLPGSCWRLQEARTLEGHHSWSLLSGVLR